MGSLSSPRMISSSAMRVGVAGVLVFIAACTPPEAKAGLGPADPSPITEVTVNPSAVTLDVGETLTFVAAAEHEDGSTSAPPIAWSATGGSISTGGVYTPGPTAGLFGVTASLVGGALSASAAVTIVAPVSPIVSLNVSPGSASLASGGVRQFSVSASREDGSSLTPAVTWSATGGSISSDGLYTAGGTPGTFRVIAVQQAGTLADTAAVTIATGIVNDMFFNSFESGCGTDPNVVLCDDFEDGDWYTKHCDAANSSGGLLQTDGWCGTIYNNEGMAAGTTRCGGEGFKSSCAATTRSMPSGNGGNFGNMGDHALSEPLDEVWVRFYTKPLSGYRFGAEKMLTFNDNNPGNGGIRWGNLSWNCAWGSAQTTGVLTMGFPSPMDVCQRQNVGNDIIIQSGNWYFYQVHYRLSTAGLSDGIFELWVDNCGPTGTTCPATPTLRMRRTDVRNARTSASQHIRVLWFEAWSNPISQGERYWDQIKVSKVGPIGFMP